MSDGRVFRTKWLQFSAFLHATNSLKYLRAEIGKDNLTYFIFADPDDRASDLEFQFSMDAQVSATKLFGSLTFMRRQMKAAQQKLGESCHEHPRQQR